MYAGPMPLGARLATMLRMTDSSDTFRRDSGGRRDELKIRRYRLVRVKLESGARRASGQERHAHLRRVYD